MHSPTVREHCVRKNVRLYGIPIQPGHDVVMGRR
jgi:hypothetical protein